MSADLIHISRGGVVIGKYPVDDMPVLLGAGTVLPTDFFWQKGMTDWLLVNSRFKVPEAPPPKVDPAPDPVPVRPADGDGFTCLRCGAKFKAPVERKPGSFFTELVYWCITPWAGGFYSASRELGKTRHCPRCDSQHIKQEIW